MCYYYVTGGI